MGELLRQQDTNVARVVVVDENEETRNRVVSFLVRRGYFVTTCRTVDDVLLRTRDDNFDVVLAYTNTPGAAEMKLVDQIASRGGGESVIISAAFATVDQAIEAMRRGAHDFLVKPFKLEQLAHSIERALKKRRSKDSSNFTHISKKNGSEPKGRFVSENKRTTPSLKNSTPLIGKSKKIIELLEIINRVAPTDSSIMITGATGTGKELVARAIHEQSRPNAEFVDINCSAIPETLIEAELFGHERGTFTGAHESRGGLFEKASGGTLFLDEVDALPPSAQVKLLRVLQERCVRRVGGRRNISVDVRIVSATNRDLYQAVKEGKFRVDLLYRLRVVPLELPELRERGEDIDLLANHFLRERCELRNCGARYFTEEALRALKSYHWPGNVRELENAVEFALAVGVNEALGLEALPSEVKRQETTSVIEKWSVENATLADMARRYVLYVFERHGGKHGETAAALGIDRRTLYNRLRQYGVLRYQNKRFRAATHLVILAMSYLSDASWFLSLQS